MNATVNRPAIVPGEISVQGVSKSYGALHMRKEVVRDCTFTIEANTRADALASEKST